MNKNVFFLVFFLAAFAICSVSTAAPAPVGTPTRAIQDLDAKLDTYKTGANLSPEDEEYNKNLKKDIIHGTFDVRELSKLALARHWNERSQKEQDEFVQLMTDLLEKRGILSKEQGKRKSKSGNVYNITYKGDKFLNAEKTRVLTRTSVYVKSEDIRVELNYKLVRKPNKEWMIYDVIVDGASLLDNYKFQFDSIIKKHGYPDLVRRMKGKLDKMA